MTSSICVQYINLPPVPDWVIATMPVEWNQEQCVTAPPEFGSYTWSDQDNDALNTWCKANICENVYWAWQFMLSDVNIHKDHDTRTKFCYLLDTGGDNVITRFFDEDRSTLVFETRIQMHRWHLLQADRFHSVINIEPGRRRAAITGRVFV